MTDARERERLAEAVHEAAWNACERVGFRVDRKFKGPYEDVPEAAKEMARASVDAVLAALDTREGA